MKIKQSIYVFLLLLCTSVANGQTEGETEEQPDQTLELQIEDEGSNRIFSVVESMPRFPGCEDEADEQVRKKCSEKKALQFLYGNIKYPAEARKNGTQGTARISFIVEADGRLTNFELQHDPGDGCGAEALRVFQTMPNWIPGMQRGVGVAVKMSYPVKFRLENGTKRKKKKRRYN